jgi:hypothetical protein
MGEQITGKVEVLTGAGKITITLDGNYAAVQAGGNGQDGVLVLDDSSGMRRVHLNSRTGLISLKNASGEDILTIGSSGNINIRRKIDSESPKEVLIFNANSAALSIGGSGAYGSIVIRNINREVALAFSAAQGTLAVGGLGTRGTIILRDARGGTNLQLDSAGQLTVKGMGRILVQNPEGKNSISIEGGSAGVTVGGGGTNGTIVLRNLQGQNTIKLDGKEGDIILQNADCAEHFEVADPTEIDPGTVVILDEKGRLRQSMKPYDRKVVGVVSGAGGLKPGILLDHKPAEKNRNAVALVGKVYCKVDATVAAVEVGDLLTTASTPGHAMKASDSTKAFGAVLGKALKPLTSGMGLIPILVALQ